MSGTGELARALAGLRRKVPKRCALCGKEFEGLKTALYCSNSCAQIAYRKRYRDELNKKRREKYQKQKEEHAG